jgi:hypothetical protein
MPKPRKSRLALPEPRPNELSDYARWVMVKRGIKPFHVSQGTDLSAAVVTRWFNGTRRLQLSSYQQIFDYLGLMIVEGPSEGRH